MSIKYWYFKLLFYIFLSEVALAPIKGTTINPLNVSVGSSIVSHINNTDRMRTNESQEASEYDDEDPLFPIIPTKNVTVHKVVASIVSDQNQKGNESIPLSTTPAPKRLLKCNNTMKSFELSNLGSRIFNRVECINDDERSAPTIIKPEVIHVVENKVRKDIIEAEFIPIVQDRNDTNERHKELQFSKDEDHKILTIKDDSTHLISSAVFVAIFVIGGVLSYRIWKFKKVVRQRHHPHDETISLMQPQADMYDDDYYEPPQTFAQNPEAMEEGLGENHDSEDPVYAKVARKAAGSKQD